jgi:glutamate 5-kinase
MKNNNNPELWVIKIGSSTITNNGNGLNENLARKWIKQIAILREKNISFLIVTSGAIAEGIRALNWVSKPSDFVSLQAAASVGQMSLIKFYETLFKELNISTAQILLTHGDFSNKERYSNVQNTIKKLVELNVIPIINENDAISTEEIGFGDNDMLAALLSNAIDATKLIIFTDQIGLMNKNPRKYDDAKLIPRISINSVMPDSIDNEKGSLGKGGMKGKIDAAKMFSLSGGSTIIVHGHAENIIKNIYLNDYVGTEIHPDCLPIEKHKRWLASQKSISAGIMISEKKIKDDILIKHIKEVKGDFKHMDMIYITNEEGESIAKGLTNYSSKEVVAFFNHINDKKIAESALINLENTLIN